MKDKPTLGVVRGIVRISIFPVITVLLLMLISGTGQSASANRLLDRWEKAAMREVREIAESAANLLNVYMDATVTEMLVSSKLGGPVSDALTRSNARSDANRVLAEWFMTSGAYDAILLLDGKGMCLAAAPESPVGSDLSNDEAFKGAIAGKLTVTDFHKSDVLTTLDPKAVGWTVHIAVPMKLKDEIPGVLISCVKWTKLRDMINRIRVGTPMTFMHTTGRVQLSTGWVFVVNRRNEIIIYFSEKHYGVSLRDPKINQPGLDEAIKRKAANHRYRFKNPGTREDYVKFAGFAYPQGYGNFSGLGWVVGAQASEDELIEKLW